MDIKTVNNQEQDAIIQNEGSIFLFHLLTQPAKDWWKENVEVGAMFGNVPAVEYCYAFDIAEGMINSGLIVK